MNKEEIRPIPGHPFYGVTKSGVIFSKAPKGAATVPYDNWSPLRTSLSSAGRYYQFGMTKGRKLMVHRAVALTFIGPVPRGMQVAHLNGNSHDNRVDNLVIVTPRVNNTHKKAHGTHLEGSLTASAKLSEQQVAAIKRALIKEVPQWILAAYFGVSEATICNIKWRRTWSHV